MPSIRDLAAGRTCKHCGEWKPAANFPKIHKVYLVGECHACRWARHKPRHAAKKRTAEGRAKIRNRRRTLPRTDKIKASAIMRAKKERLKPDALIKEKAYRFLQQALRKGILVRPAVCEKCGLNPGTDRRGFSLIQAHHHNYQYPLDVEWVCTVCHNLEHYPLDAAA